MAGSAAELISHPHLQEPMPAATIQPQRYMNEVLTTGLDMLIQRTAQLEPPQAVPPREQLRLHRDWAGQPAFRRPKPFPRLPFMTSFSGMLSEWGMTPPPPQAGQPENWPATWAAAQAAHTTSREKEDLERRVDLHTFLQHCRSIDLGRVNCTSRDRSIR